MSRRGSISKPSRSGRVMAWVVLVVAGMLAGMIIGAGPLFGFWVAAMMAARAQSWTVGHLAKAFPDSFAITFVAVIVVLAVGA